MISFRDNFIIVTFHTFFLDNLNFYYNILDLKNFIFSKTKNIENNNLKPLYSAYKENVWMERKRKTRTKTKPTTPKKLLTE